jgi:hypothetical protein
MVLATILLNSRVNNVPTVALFTAASRKFIYVGFCKTWSHTLRTENRLRVFKNRVLKIIFGPKGQNMTGDFIIGTLCQHLPYGQIKKDDTDSACSMPTVQFW